MTTRTASLILLLLVSLVLSAVLLAGATVLTGAWGGGGPWMMPVIAAACHVLVLCAGRRFIVRAYRAPLRECAFIASVVLGALSLAVIVALFLRMIAGGAIPGPLPVVLMWWGLIWLVLSRWERPRATRWGSAMP